MDAPGSIFIRFLKFGALAWGGPAAQIAMIKRECVDEERWISVAALETTVAQVESAALERGAAEAVQATFGVSDGNSLWAVRYATAGSPRSLFASGDIAAIRELYPDNERFRQLTDDDRLIVSEPFSDLPGVWDEIPPATAVTVQHGGVLEQRPFRPRA